MNLSDIYKKLQALPKSTEFFTMHFINSIFSHAFKRSCCVLQLISTVGIRVFLKTKKKCNAFNRENKPHCRKRSGLRLNNMNEIIKHHNVWSFNVKPQLSHNRKGLSDWLKNEKIKMHL